MKNYLKTIQVLTITLIRRFMRDKTALFFTFLFPLIFLLVFGALNKGNENLKFNIVLINNSKSQFSQQFVGDIKGNKIFEVKNSISSVDQAKEKMSRGEVDSIIELPSSFGEAGKNGVPSGKVVVYYQEGSQQTGETLASVMQQFLDQINAKLIQQADPFVVERKSTKTANLTAFDYVFSGLIGFSILSLGVFGMANGFPADKKNGVLRRLKATPLRASQLIIATALEYLLIGITSIALMFAVGMAVFNFHMRGDYLNFSLFVLAGIILMFGFGLAIGGWAKNENQSAPLSNLVSFPMMFLSGVFFPRFMMPEWLQSITSYVPLTPIVDGLRMIITEGKTVLALGNELAIMAVWIVVIYALAIRLFRWE